MSFVDMDWHPAAKLMPLMGDAELRELADDVRANGLRTPIVLLAGSILDGRNRHRACQLAGVEPQFSYVTTLEIGDPFTYVASLNLHRRHLSESQRAMVGAKLKEHFAAQARERMVSGKALEPSPKFGGGSGGEAADEAAALVNVSRGSVESAARVLAKGVPELVEAVERGEVAVSAAAEVARMPVEAQRAAVAVGGVPQAAKAVREARKAKPVPVETDEDLDPGEPDDDAREVTVFDPSLVAAPEEVDRTAAMSLDAIRESRVMSEYVGLAIRFRDEFDALNKRSPIAALRDARMRNAAQTAWLGAIGEVLKAIPEQAEAHGFKPRVIDGGKQ